LPLFQNPARDQRKPGSGQGAHAGSLDNPSTHAALGGPRNPSLPKGAFLLPPRCHEDVGEGGVDPSERDRLVEGGNKNDGTLYTPDDLSITLFLQVCPAETLGCFRLELSVIGFEEGPTVGTAVFRLQRLLDALGSRLWIASPGPCLPCEGHPQRPVPIFLAKLLELLQGACAQHLPAA
ncbi:hypothetical protein TREES_T100012839, partial [Tupaia chinensis]